MYLHVLNLVTPSAVVGLTLQEDFSVAGGINTSGELVFPSCPVPSYLIAGGPQCLQYAPRLGHGAVEAKFTFPVTVTALIVATESGLRPVPEVYVGPRNLPPSMVVLKNATVIDQRNKYSDNYEHLSYYTVKCTWARTDTNELLTPGPDAPEIIYQFTAQGSQPNVFIGYSLAALKGPDFVDVVRFVDDFATI